MFHIICEKHEWRDRAEDSSLLGCDIVSLSGCSPAFRRIAVPSSSGSSSPDRFILTLWSLEKTGNTHHKALRHITEHSNLQQYRCERLNFLMEAVLLSMMMRPRFVNRCPTECLLISAPTGNGVENFVTELKCLKHSIQIINTNQIDHIVEEHNKIVNVWSAAF
jgi:hypothetical protein